MKKILIIIAAIIVVLGLSLFAVALIASGFDLTNLGSVKYETNIYTVAEDFNDIDISTLETNVILLTSEDGRFSVVCEEREKVKHSVSVENGVLKIAAKDERLFYEHFSLFNKIPSMKVYLPSDRYGVITVKNTTGDVSVPDRFSFDSVNVVVSTGDVFCGASASGSLKIKASTGDVAIKGANAENIEVSVSTGTVSIESLDCEKKVSVVSGSGKTTLTDINCSDLFVKGGTGRRTLTNVYAENELKIENGTGDVTFNSCDGGSIFVKATTGDVKGTIRTEKIFSTKTSTGKVRVPDSTSGGICEIKTTTGDIEIRLSSN